MIHHKNIGVDFDNTLTNEICYTPEEVLSATPKQDIIDKVNALHSQNFIVIYTARRDYLLPASLEWLKRHGVRFHAISNNKIPLDLYIDDLAVHIDDVDELLS